MESNNTKRLSQYTNMFVVQLGACLNTIHSYFHCYSLAKRNNGCHCFQLTTTALPRYLGRTLLTFIVLQINVTFCYIKLSYSRHRGHFLLPTGTIVPVGNCPWWQDCVRDGRYRNSHKINLFVSLMAKKNRPCWRFSAWPRFQWK